MKQLYDPITSITYGVDRNAMILRVEIDGDKQEYRPKPLYLMLLVLLFEHHPNPVSYEQITSCLKEHKQACPDTTRLHRKMSELKKYLASLSPALASSINNYRSIGYSLPLKWQEPYNTKGTSLPLANPVLDKAVNKLKDLVRESINITAKSSIINHDDRYILDRKPSSQELSALIEQLNSIEHIILQEIRMSEADFLYIRTQYSLAKLRTYIGLARISEFSISHSQWCDWHQHEVMGLLREISNVLKALR